MAVDFYLKLDGVTGEATETGFENQIQIQSFSWGASAPNQVGVAGGSGAGKPSLAELSISKYTDKASPTLLKSLLMGQHIAKGTLSASKTGDGSKAFYTYDLGEVFVTSVQVSGSMEVPMESVSFTFKTIKVSYFAQDDKGALKAAGDVTYDLKTNKAV